MTDRNECMEDMGLCVNGTENLAGSGEMYVQGVCVDIVGGFRCECERGYIFNETLNVCMGESVAFDILHTFIKAAKLCNILKLQTRMNVSS